MATPDPKCAHCAKTAADLNGANLSRCAKCRQTVYCNRDCQKAHWKTHKKVCASQANAANSSSSANVDANSTTNSAPRLKDLDVHIAKPFTALVKGTYLHDRSETDVYKLLIDSFRMRQADDANLEDKTTPQSLYTGAASSIVPFRAYLAKAGTRRGLLPPWWTADKQKECEAYGESGAWSDLRKKTSKQEVIAHYGDSRAPMQVRMLAEAIYGVGSMGQSGAEVRSLMMEMENGEREGMVTSTMDVSKLFDRR